MTHVCPCVTLSLLVISSMTQHDQGLACPPLAPESQSQGPDLAVGAPAGGGIPLPLPGQGLGHLVDHELYDELLVFILVVTDERHGGAHHLGEERRSGEERSRKCMGAWEGKDDKVLEKLEKGMTGNCPGNKLWFERHRLPSVGRLVFYEIAYSLGHSNRGEQMRAYLPAKSGPEPVSVQSPPPPCLLS